MHPIPKKLFASIPTIFPTLRLASNSFYVHMRFFQEVGMKKQEVSFETLLVPHVVLLMPAAMHLFLSE